MADLQSSLIISMQVSLAATLGAALVGLPLAYVLARPGWRGRTLVDVIVNLPLALPPTVLGYYLLLLIGKSGPIGRLTLALWDTTLIFTPAAAALASMIVSLPLFVQAARNAIEEVPTEVFEAAQVDGAGRGPMVRLVLIPLAWTGIWSGVLMAYARSLGEFGATLMVAGNIPGRTQTLSLAIYSAVQSGQQSTANMIAIILTSVAGISLWAGLRWRRPAARRQDR